MEGLNCIIDLVHPGQKCAVLGIGSVLRSDDGAGMYFIELLRDLLQTDTESTPMIETLLIEGSTAPENFTGVIKKFKPDKLFIIDAAHMDLLPGETKVVPACEICGVSYSTHMLPLSVMLKYLESESGCEVVFFGIQPRSTEQGFGICDEVKAGTRRLAEAFRKAFE